MVPAPRPEGSCRPAHVPPPPDTHPPRPGHAHPHPLPSSMASPTPSATRKNRWRVARRWLSSPAAYNALVLGIFACGVLLMVLPAELLSFKAPEKAEINLKTTFSTLSSQVARAVREPGAGASTSRLTAEGGAAGTCQRPYHSPPPPAAPTPAGLAVPGLHRLWLCSHGAGHRGRWAGEVGTTVSAAVSAAVSSGATARVPPQAARRQPCPPTIPCRPNPWPLLPQLIS